MVTYSGGYTTIGALFLTLVYLSLSCLGRQYGSQDQPVPACRCTREYVPVCCGGKQYANQCLADCAGATNCKKSSCSESGDDIKCKASDTPVNCFANPCDVSTCPAYPDAKCLASYCNDGLYRDTKVGPCEAIYVDPDTGDVLDCDYGNVDDIKCTGGTIYCFVDPCQFATCPNYPNAACLSSYCIGTYRGTPVGGCQALFVDKKSGDIIDCGESRCVCPEVYQPVCCNGNDYGNICEAECAGEDMCQKNTCDEGCICTLQFDPVCCKGVQYGNACQAACSLASGCNDGPCDGEAGLDAKLVGSWTLVKIKQSEGLLPFPGAKATIKFTNEGPSQGTLGGTNGCNTYGGDYKVPEKGVLDIGALFQTEIACLGAGGKLEGLYMPLITKVDGFQVGPTKLKLFIGKNKVLVFKKD